MSIKQGSNYIAGGGGGVSQVNIDNLTITKNTSDELQTIGVINQNNSTIAIKTWTGTKAQYDAIVTKDANTEYFCTDNGELYIGDVKIGSGGGLEIGDIGFAPLGIDETQNKRRYLNGQVISQTQFVSFTNKIKSAIALYPSLSATETNWQAEVTNSKLGQCGKFVIDDTAGTIRLPKVVNINGLQDLALMGGIKAESLPNIRGTAGLDPTAGLLINTGTPTGVFYKSNAKNTRPSGSDDSRARDLGFDASRSSSTYQDNAPVQQEAVQYPYYIQVATGSEESVDVSTEIQLNNPFFFGMHIWSDTAISNASWLISNGSYHSGATYASFYEWLLKIKNGTLTVDGVSVKAYGASGITDYDYVINTADTTFRLPVKVKLASGNRVAGNGMTLGLTDGSDNSGLVSYNGDTYTRVALGANLNYYGTSIGTVPTDGNRYKSTTYGITTDPTKSGIETSANGLKLYFYVGETIQDANVIVASQVLTDVANLKAHSIVETYVNGTSWYRVYSDGWCEQGGCVSFSSGSTQTINLLKQYVNTSYTILDGFVWTSFTANSGHIKKGNKTVSSFQLVAYDTLPESYWETKGYIS